MLGRWLSVDEFTVDVASALEAALAVTTTTGRDGCNVWNPPRLPLLPRRLGRRREGRRTLDPVAATMVGMAHSDIVAVPDRMARRCLCRCYWVRHRKGVQKGFYIVPTGDVSYINLFFIYKFLENHEDRRLELCSVNRSRDVNAAVT